LGISRRVGVATASANCGAAAARPRRLVDWRRVCPIMTSRLGVWLEAGQEIIDRQWFALGAEFTGP
jgi:hypothetical protein